MAGWVELHTHSNYSFLDGASDVDDLADAAIEQGLDTLALTDTNGLYGAVRFANAAKERGLRPIFGAELHLQDMGHIVLIARDRQGVVERIGRGAFSAFRVVRDLDWIVGSEISGAPGLTLHAYRISDGAFASTSGGNITALALLGPAKPPIP